MENNNINKLESWMSLRKHKDWEGVNATQLERGKWLCEIMIPDLNLKSRIIADTEYEAKSGAAEIANAIIREFLYHNMNTQTTIQSIRDLGIEIGENGEIESNKLAKIQNERSKKFLNDNQKVIELSQGEIFEALDRLSKTEAAKKRQEQIEKAINIIKKAIDDLQITESHKDDLFIQVFSKNLYPKAESARDIVYNLSDEIYENYHRPLFIKAYGETDSSVIIIGSTPKMNI